MRGAQWLNRSSYILVSFRRKLSCGIPYYLAAHPIHILLNSSIQLWLGSARGVWRAARGAGMGANRHRRRPDKQVNEPDTSPRMVALESSTVGSAADGRFVYCAQSCLAYGHLPHLQVL